MNFGKMGLVVFVLGLVIAAGAGMHWMSLDRRAANVSVEATLADNAYDRLDRLGEGQSLGQKMDAMRPWMIGGSIAAVLGLGMIFAAGGSAAAMRTCPKCAEAVRVAAVVCKHCGADLKPVSPDQSKSSYRALAKAAEDAERKVKRG